MPGCSRCGRPVALARASCLYCGAPLSPDALAAARAAAPAAQTGAAPEGSAEAAARVLVILDLQAASADAVATATGLPAYDARLLARRGGLHLLRAAEAARAEADAARIEALGLRVFQVPEAEARARPLRIVAGERIGDALRLRGEGAAVELAPAQLLLVVTGEIVRERQRPSGRRRIDSARPAQGRLVHLHRRDEPRPLEIDADNFSPGFALTGSARLEIEAWLEAVAHGVARDDDFRRLPAVLSPAEPEAGGPLAAASALRRTPTPAPRGGPAAASAVLDNAAQFRFYSGWRAAVERRLRGSLPTLAAC